MKEESVGEVEHESGVEAPQAGGSAERGRGCVWAPMPLAPRENVRNRDGKSGRVHSPEERRAAIDATFSIAGRSVNSPRARASTSGGSAAAK